MLTTILLAILALPIFHEDTEAEDKRAQLEAIANAVAAVAQTPDEAAFLLAWGNAESNYSLRIHRGECNSWECDAGRARGPWQAHRNGMPEERWEKMIGVDNVEVQAQHALFLTRWALHACPHDRIRGAFRVLAGRACTSPIRGEAGRVSSYRWVRSVIAAGAMSNARTASAATTEGQRHPTSPGAN
jgi:hypothetical protein